MFKALEENLHFVPYNKDHEDGEALAFSCTENHKAKLIYYFANPDNPMGSWWDAGYVESMIQICAGGISADSR